MYINTRLHTLHENLQCVRCQTELRLIKYLQEVPPNITGLWVYEALFYLSRVTRDSWNCPKIRCVCVIWINHNANKIWDNIMTSVYRKKQMSRKECDHFQRNRRYSNRKKSRWHHLQYFLKLTSSSYFWNIFVMRNPNNCELYVTFISIH